MVIPRRLITAEEGTVPDVEADSNPTSETQLPADPFDELNRGPSSDADGACVPTSATRGKGGGGGKREATVSAATGIADRWKAP